MIKIVSFKICPFVQRVTALLEAKRVPYEIEYIDLNDKPEWFLEASPNGQVPILLTESGDVLFESDAIAEYLDDVHAPLRAGIRAEQRARERAWSYQASKHYLVQCSAQRSPDESILAERSARLGKAFEKAENVLHDGPYFAGTALGNVDIAWLPLLHRADIIARRTGYDFVGNYPRVKAWQAALLETGLAEKSVSDDFEQRFADFYLSDETWLGNPTRSMESEACCDAGCCGA